MNYKDSHTRQTSRCLECGDTINYGRKDKKFCCEDCKNRYHNSLARMSKNMKRKVMSALDKNYSVLDRLFRLGVDAVWLPDAEAMGFTPGYFTSCRKIGKKDRFFCFDISYAMTPNRISSISKIQNLSLPLQNVHDDRERYEED